MTNVATVTVITPTLQRHDLLIERCIPSVKAQEYREFRGFQIKHIVVSDGPDPELREKLADQPVHFAELPEHRGKCGTYAINHGAELADDGLITVLDDDNAMRPNHCQALYDAMWEPLRVGAPLFDFAFSQVFRHGIGDTIGSDPPRLGGIDGNALMWWARTHQRFGMWPHVDRWPDWRLVSRWLRQGASYVHVPEVTVDYYYHPGALSWRG